MRLFGWTVAKECGGRWFPGIGRGRWDGWHYFLFRSKKMNLEFRTFEDGWAIGPLMFWKNHDRKQLEYAVAAVRALCETIISNADGHKPPGPSHPTREQATALRIRAELNKFLD